MKSLIGFTLISHLLGAVVLADDPFVDLWLVQTDHKTGGFLEKAIEDGTMSASKIEEKLDSMIADRTVTELARFNQRFKPNGQRLKFEKDRKPITVADGVPMPGGISIEAEPNIGHSDLVDFRFALERTVEMEKNKIHTERTNTAMTIKGNQWEIFCHWGDEKQTTLMLGRFSGVDPKADTAETRLLEVRYQSEIRWCESADLKKFALSTPATRSKAITWLKDRSKPIATSGLRIRSGQMSTQDNLLQWIHDSNRGWDTKDLGWGLELETTIGPQGKLIDFQLNSHFHPRDARQAPVKPEFDFDFATTTESGTSVVIQPDPNPAAGPVPVIFITPTVHVVVDAAESPSWSNLPEEGNLGTVSYPVHPSLIRKLAEISKFNPNPKPGMIARPILKDMLEDLGLDFPAGCSAMFKASGCQVYLTHDRQGHQLFKKILDENGLAMAKE